MPRLNADLEVLAPPESVGDGVMRGGGLTNSSVRKRSDKAETRPSQNISGMAVEICRRMLVDVPLKFLAQTTYVLTID